MHNGQNSFCHDIIFKFIQQVIHLNNRTCRGILDRQNRVIRGSFFDRLHRVAERPHMETVHILPKELLHRCLAVCPFCPLKYDPGILLIQVIDPDKRKAPQGSCFHELLVLKFPAHGHKLLVKFLDPLLIEVPVHP